MINYSIHISVASLKSESHKVGANFCGIRGQICQVEKEVEESSDDRENEQLREKEKQLRNEKLLLMQEKRLLLKKEQPPTGMYLNNS